VYPLYSTIPYDRPVIIEMEFKTLKSNFGDLGEEKRRRKWLYPKRHITLSYNYITNANAATIWDFYMDRSGSYEAFNVFVEYGVATDHTGEYVGTGDATTSGFNLPSKDASSRTLYVAGATQTVTTDYVYTAQGGADNADKVEFVTPPTTGQRITYDFTGTLKVHSKFKEDIQSFEVFNDSFINIGVSFKGLLNE